MSITILGLGPGDAASLTRRAWDLLCQSGELYLRTARHPAVAGLPGHLAVHSFDDLYEALDELPHVYDAIAARILELGRRPQGVLYAVPGHPLLGETSVRTILQQAREQGLAVRLVDGLSFVEPVLSLLGRQGTGLPVDGLDGLQLADATELAAAHHPQLDPDRPALVGQLYDRRLAGEVKLTLMAAYPDDHPVTLVRAAGTAEESLSTFPLYELDRGQSIDHLTALYVPPQERGRGLSTLQQTVARLRAPGGCPWDREQTHQSLAPSLLEETYELLAAIDADDPAKMCEELGDLLMQIMMQTQIAAEGGEFRMADVVYGIDSKLKRRHPHVFGDLQVSGSAEVLRNWETIKAAERKARHEQEGGGATSASPSSLDGVPAVLPALARAQTLGERAARVGFDWPDLEGVLAKVGEEVAELRGAADAQARADELGDLLFTLVNAARWLEVDAEGALRVACDRFSRRYREAERSARGRGRELSGLSPAELDALWEEAKALERGSGPA